MTSLSRLDGLGRIAGDYQAIFCDVWGVVHDGRKAFASACEALGMFRRRHGPVILITNAPVPKERVTALFPRLGVPADCFDDVVTSGEATTRELLRHAPGPVYPIGLAGDASVYAGLDLEFTTEASRARVVCCTSLREVPDGRPETYRDELQELIGRGLTMICANPDLQFRYGDRLIWSAGSLAALYESLGGRVIRPGKPDEAIYRLSFERLVGLMKGPVAASAVLGIGDGPATDVLGATGQGMDALFIGGGIHGHAMADGEGFLETARSVLEADGARARYAMPVLRW
jgi:HAD superfamily hydrolase (TIGR01459 family)